MTIVQAILLGTAVTVTPLAGAVATTIARRLPTPPVALDAPPQAFLAAARDALEAGRTGKAQEALERAETRLLDRSAAATASAPIMPDRDVAVLDIGVARRALALRDRAGALRAIDDALASSLVAPTEPHLAARAANRPPAADLVPPVAPVAPAAPVPTATYALLPGHWRLSGANWKWVNPETRLRPVFDRQLIPGHSIWLNGAWRWVPAH